MNWKCLKCDRGEMAIFTGFPYLFSHLNGCQYCTLKDKPMTDQAKPLTLTVCKYYRNEYGDKLLYLCKSENYHILEYVASKSVVTLTDKQLAEFGIVSEWIDDPPVLPTIEERVADIEDCVNRILVIVKHYCNDNGLNPGKKEFITLPQKKVTP